MMNEIFEWFELYSDEVVAAAMSSSGEDALEVITSVIDEVTLCWELALENFEVEWLKLQAE